MADQHSDECANTSNVSGESSESTVELNIKTLDSQIYSFHVDKNMPVSVFKESIASKIGVPVGRQRLIFRGKVLKDNHLLSEYHVENGHTLHLVARQPSQPQPSSGTSSGETTANISNTGQDASAAGSRPLVGQVSHSVVLGTFGVGDQSEGGVPDINRVIGAVLNSFGIVNQTAMGGTGGSQPNMQFNTPVHDSQGNEIEGSRVNVNNQSQGENQAHPRHAFAGQSMPQVLQIPLGAAIAVPTLSAPIPDSLITLSEFMNRMELALSQQGGYQPNQPLNNAGDLPAVELPSNARALPTPAALAVVLRHAQRLLSGPAIASLSHIAGRLEEEEGSTDVTVRSRLQTESMQAGLAMQHLGALLLELGRTMLTLRIGQSPVESSLNAGPAVYISPSGPNPIMVQPFPLQTSSLFGGYAAPPSNAGPLGPAGIGAVPRHVNIHIHAGIGRATNGEANGTGDSGQTRELPLRNVSATAVPSRPTAVSVPSAAQPTVAVSQPSPDPVLMSTIIAGVNSQIRNIVDNMRSENQASAGQPDRSTSHNQSIGSGAGNDETSNHLSNLAGDGVGETSPLFPGCVPETGRMDAGAVLDLKHATSSSTAANTESCSIGETTLKSVNDAECAPTSSLGADNSERATAVPLGLGLGGLEPKRRSRQSRSQGRNSDGLTSNARTTDQNLNSRPYAREVLLSLANTRNANTLPSGQLPSAVGEIIESMPSEEHGQFDPASIVSQVIQSPAIDGLLSGFSQQTGFGSPEVLRNMLGQLTQNPAMMNTVNQLAQQIDRQELGSMFSGMVGGQGGGGGGGGIDLSRMVQQMMPIVSQALGGGSNVTQQVPAADHELQQCYNERMPSNDEKPNDQHSQINLQNLVQTIQHQDPPEEVFSAVVESAVRLYDNGSGTGGLADELCSEEGLASEFMEMLRRDVSRRLQDESGNAEKS